MARQRKLLSEAHFSIDGTLIDAWASHLNDGVSQGKRQSIEPTFGWLKPYAGLRRPIVRGLARMNATVTLAATALNLLHMRNLLAGAVG
jgi:hypothetical protein